uniref:Flo11 domain-containing protein n=1 Tax=Strongyloides venezuelensis TaxID=75913 RepID=A0A0K0F3Z2_STRVS
MQRIAYLYLLALLATPIFCGSHETSASKSAEENKNTCSELADDDGSSGKPILIEALYNISITLSGSSQTTFNNFIVYLEDKYFESGNYTSIEIVLECSFEIYQFFMSNSNYYSEFQFITIGEWGSFYDLFQVGIYLSADNFNGCWSENSSGEYDLLISFQTFQATLSSSDQATFNTYITQLEVILSSTEDVSVKYEQFYSLCIQITTDHPEWESSFLSTDCGSMGSLYMLLQISLQYYRISLVPSLFSGTPECQFVQGLESCLTNPSYTISASDKAYINATIMSFQETISDESLTIIEQMQIIIYQYEQFLLTYYYLDEVFLSFQISAEFGTFQDFISIFTFGQTQDCWPDNFETTSSPLPETEVTSGETSGEVTGATSGEVTSGEETGVTSGEETGVTSGEETGVTSGEETGATSGEETEATTEEVTEETTEESTYISTTVSPSTSTTNIKTTTVPRLGVCATATKQCLALSGNWSVIYTSSTTQWKSWTASQKTNWKNQCTSFTKKYIKNAKMTPVQKIKGVVSSIKSYVKLFTYMKIKIFAIKIAKWGTIGQLCGCY